MIIEDYCSKELTGFLKEKGYVGSTNIYLDKDGFKVEQITIQTAMKWLRDKGYIIVVRHTNNNGYFGVVEEMEEGKEVYHFDGYNSCEEACEAAIKYCLENLI